MDINKLKGVGTALVTPFRKDGSIDFRALGSFIEFQIENGIGFLVALGTTSEAATMTKDEKHAIIDFIIETINGRVPLVVGCGGNNTSDVVHQLRKFDIPGIDAILSVVPYYNKPNQVGLYEHFKAVANASKLPVILYNVPSRTGASLTAKTIIRLANDFKNIIGLKEASGNFSESAQIIKNKPKKFIVLSGEDALTLPLISIGFEGVISVLSNVYPAQVVQMVRLANNSEFAKARDIHYKFIEIIESLFEEGNPSGVKMYLSIQNLVQNNLRLPLVSVSKDLERKIKALEKQYK